MSFFSKLADSFKGVFSVAVKSTATALMTEVSADIIAAVKAEVDELEELNDAEKEAAKLGIDLIVKRIAEAVS